MLPESQGNASLQLLTADLHLKRQHVLGLWVQRPERPVPDRGHASWGRAWAGGGWSAGVDSRHTHTHGHFRGPHSWAGLLPGNE